MADHLFKIFIGLRDMHSILHRVLAHADQFGQVVFVDPVDSVIVEYTDDFHVHGSICHFPFIKVIGSSAHADYLFLNAVRVFLVAAGSKDQLECGPFQQFPQLVDFVDILICDFLDRHGFIIVGYDQSFCLQSVNGCADRTSAHTQPAAEQGFGQSHAGRIGQV